MTAQPTIADLLGRLNSLRADCGQPPLKSWKASRANLDTALTAAKVAAEAALEKKIADAEVTVIPAHAAKGVKAPRSTSKRVKVAPITTGLADTGEKPAKQPKAAKASKARKSTPSTDSFTLADLARELGINPKVARAKARRHSKELDAMRSGDSWDFANSHKAAVSKIIKGA